MGSLYNIFCRKVDHNISKVYTLDMKTMLNIKIDTQLKDKAKEVANELGIPLGTITVALLRQFVREKEVNLSIEHKPSRSLIDSINEAEKEYSEGKLKEHKSLKSLFKSLGV